MFKEWKFDNVEDLGQCSGVCPCGKKGIRFKHHIQNIVTEEMAHVGSKCIELFGRNMKIIRKVAETFLRDGFTGTCKLIEKKFVRFSVSGTLIIVKHQSEMRKYFNKFPLRKQAEEYTLDVKIPPRFDRKIFKVGKSFRILTKMAVNMENNLELEVQKVNKKRIERRQSAFVNQFIMG